MSNLYIRYFSSPADREPGTVLSLGFMTARGFNRPRVQQYLQTHGIVVEPLTRPEFVCRDEEGLSPSEAEVVLRPPLEKDQMIAFGRIIAHSVNASDDWVNVVDCTAENASLNYPYVAQA